MKKPNEDLNHDKVSGEVVQIPLEKIIPNRFQSRKTIVSKTHTRPSTTLNI